MINFVRKHIGVIITSIISILSLYWAVWGHFDKQDVIVENEKIKQSINYTNFNHRVVSNEKGIKEIKEKIDNLDKKEDANYQQLNHKYDKLNHKIDATYHKLNNKIDANYQKLDNKIDAIYNKLNDKIDKNHNELKNLILKSFINKSVVSKQE